MQVLARGVFGSYSSLAIMSSVLEYAYDMESDGLSDIMCVLIQL
jgi:hypothetical protein